MVLGAVVIVIIGILIVNYFKDSKGQTSSEALTTINQEQTSKTHTVVKGETLWGISEDTYGSGYNWTDVYKANNLRSQKIEIGQVLTLPDVSTKQPTATKQVSTIAENTTKIDSISPVQAITSDSYTVVHGDNLWKIAVKAYGDGYKWVAIAKANGLKNPGVIHSGNVLSLPR